MGIEQSFVGLSAKKFVRVIKIAIWLSIGASIGITFFCHFFRFLKCYWTWSVNLATPGGFFRQFFQNCLRSQKRILRGSVFSKKGFVFLLKVYGKVTKKFLIFIEKSMQVVQTAVYISRAVFWGLFRQKKLKVCCAKQFRTSAESFNRIAKNAFQH